MMNDPGNSNVLRDIGDRTRADQELRRNQRLMSAALRSAKAGVWSWNADTNEVTWSPEQYALFGRDPDHPVSFADWQAAIHPDDRDRMLCFAEALRSSPSDCRAEFRILTPGGERWILAVGQREPDAGADTVGYVGMNFDITDQKLAEARVRESELRYRALADSTPDGFAAFDRDLRYVYWNKAAEARTGLKAEQVLGKTRLEVWGDTESVRLTNAKLRECMETGRPLSLELPTLAPGRTEWIHARMVPMPDGVATFLRDITGQKAADRELRTLYARVQEEKNRLALVLDNIHEEVWFHDADGRVILANPAALAAFGDVEGREIAEAAGRLAVLRADGTPRPDAETPIARALAGEEIRDLEETVQLPVSGALRIRSVTSVPAHGPDGAVLGVVSVVRDVTESKRTEAELRASEQRFREADRRKDVFLATLSHELRNPLAPIRNAASLLENSSLRPEIVERSRSIIARQVRHMAALLDDLLDMSRITRGAFTLKKETVNLQRLLAEALETARPSIDARRHTLALDWPSDPVHIEADPVRVVQILTNLLTNAAKYTDPEGRIDFTACVDGQQLRLTVRDTGIGLAPEALPRVFDMFSQVTPDQERTEGGLGIGLSLVKGLVELHGGCVEARSAGLERGSEFVVTLPCGPAAGPAGRVSPPTARADAAGAGRRVLIADDNRDGAESMGMLLELSGHRIYLAHTGPEAVSLAREQRPDAVILDIGMPGLSGYDVARIIRSETWGARMMLVAMTGWGQEDDKRKAKEAGFDHHLTKPVDAAMLESLIDGAAPIRENS